MKLMEQCRCWSERNEYQKIIDSIEALPDEERTPEFVSELARAYNNLAGNMSTRLEKCNCYKKAIELLKPYEEYFKEDHNWNFRIAYAYYYLEEEFLALGYFKKALEVCPEDKDTQEFIDGCQQHLALPLFEKSFRERTEESWELFQRREAELRCQMDLKQNAASEQLIAACKELLNVAFSEINFELGFCGEKYELILTPEGNKAKLFELAYYQRHVPKTVLEHWNILLGRQPSSGFQLLVPGFHQEISGTDVQAWIQTKEESPEQVALTLYSEKLLPFLKEDKNQVWWMLSVLTDQILGEIPAMSLLSGFEVVDIPKTEPGILLEDLPQALKAMGLNLNPDPEQYLENGYVVYKMEPDEDSNADWRFDVFAGSTRCPRVINEYLEGNSSIMDEFHQDGAVPGFICYPLDCFAKETEPGKAALNFRDALEEALLKEAGADSVTILGGALGIFYGYLDFIAWDLNPVLKAAIKFFRDNPVEWATFHTFRRDVNSVGLKG